MITSMDFLISPQAYQIYLLTKYFITRVNFFTQKLPFTTRRGRIRFSPQSGHGGETLRDPFKRVCCRECVWGGGGTQPPAVTRPQQSLRHSHPGWAFPRMPPSPGEPLGHFCLQQDSFTGEFLSCGSSACPRLSQSTGVWGSRGGDQPLEMSHN